MEEMTKLSYREYLAFLLLYAAYADQSLERDEIRKIQENVQKEEFIRMNQLVKSLNDQQRLDVVLRYKPEYLPGPESLEKVLKDIEAVFTSDRHFQPVEKYYMSFLKKLLSQG